jgi:hypothetical protein
MLDIQVNTPRRVLTTDPVASQVPNKILIDWS